MNYSFCYSTDNDSCHGTESRDDRANSEKGDCL